MRKILKSKLNMQKFGNVRDSLPAIAHRFQDYLKVMVPKLRLLLEIITNFLHKLPWRKIGFVSFAILITMLLSIRFYFASPTRIKNQLQKSSVTLTDVDNAITNTDITLKSLTDSNLEDLGLKLENIQKLVGDNKNELPAKFLFDIAFSNQDDEFKTMSKNLYNPANIVSFESINNSAETLKEAIKVADELLNNRKIDKNTEEYISFLKISITSLQETDTNSDVDLATFIRIITYINETALDYQQSNDLPRYTTRYENLSSELGKEIKLAWTTSLGGKIRQQVSAQASTQQSIINKLD